MINLTSWGLTNRSSGKLFLTEQLKQNPNPNGVAAAVYEDFRVVQDPLDAPLVASNTIQGPKIKRQRHSTETDSGCQIIRMIVVDWMYLGLKPEPL